MLASLSFQFSQCLQLQDFALFADAHSSMYSLTSLVKLLSSPAISNGTMIYLQVSFRKSFQVDIATGTVLFD